MSRPARPAPSDAATPKGMVLVGRFGAAHGIRGEVRLKSFTADPLAIAEYGPLSAADGRRFTLATARQAAGSSSPDMLVVRVKGVADRNAAGALTNLDLYLPRDWLPEPESADEFYHADLIGLAAALEDGTELGTVVGLPNFGAGDLVEIAPPRGPTLLLPFTRAVVPVVDLDARRITVVPPDGFFEPSEPEDGEDRS